MEAARKPSRMAGPSEEDRSRERQGRGFRTHARAGAGAGGLSPALRPGRAALGPFSSSGCPPPPGQPPPPPPPPPPACSQAGSPPQRARNVPVSAAARAGAGAGAGRAGIRVRAQVFPAAAAWEPAAPRRGSRRRGGVPHARAHTHTLAYSHTH